MKEIIEILAVCLSLMEKLTAHPKVIGKESFIPITLIWLEMFRYSRDIQEIFRHSVKDLFTVFP